MNFAKLVQRLLDSGIFFGIFTLCFMPKFGDLRSLGTAENGCPRYYTFIEVIRGPRISDPPNLRLVI